MVKLYYKVLKTPTIFFKKGWFVFMGNKSRFNFTIESFSQGVTGSNILICIQFPDGESKRLLIDCGMFQEKEYSNQNENFAFYPNKIDAALITHNHADHIARLPFLVKNGFEAPIFTSLTNVELMPPALEDSCKVLRNLATFKKTQCFYSDSDVSKTISMLKPCNWEVPISINQNIKCTFFKNGHLVGATLILVQISFPSYEDINILFTGDYKSSNMFFSVPKLPKWVLDLPLTVVIESTYGDKNSNDIEFCFNKNVISAINNNSTVICPVFSQGRAQEVLYELTRLQESSLLSTEIPIFLDGNLAIKYTERYKNCPDILPNMRNFLPENFSYVDKDLRESLLYNTESKIILTSSGMGSYGPAQIYIPEYITRKNALIHFTGYCAEDTLGYKLKKAQNGTAVNVGGRVLKKSAQVEFTSEFSAHAKADELISFLNQFSDLKMVLVNHGAPTVKEKFAARVLDEVHTKDVAILGKGYSFRLDRYGFVKSFPSTKF